MIMMKTVWKRLREMGEATYTILRGGLLVSCALLVCSLTLTLTAGPLTFDTYYIHAVANAMRDMAPGILFIAVVGSACVESRTQKA